MRFLSGLIIAVIIGGVTIFGIYSYAGMGDSPSEITSPLPEKLSYRFYSELSGTRFWLPSMRRSQKNVDAKGQSLKLPEISAKSAISYDLSTNTLLFDKNINMKLPIASLTKIMTAIIVLENGKESDIVEVTKSAVAIGEDSMGLSQDEKVTVKELLYGLFLNSGNDAAEALSQAGGMGRDNFIYQMNKKAEDLGLASTHFTNPTGLQGDGNQYSTVHDLLVITRYALEKPVISEIARLPYYFIPYTNTHKAYELYNETNLLTTYPGVKGVKTGFTDEAGLCLVTYLEYGGHKIIAIVLNSPSRREEMIQILDYSLKSLEVKPPTHG